MDEGQDTAVRPLKEQNDMDNRNLEKKAANLNTKWGGQRSQANSVAFSPDGSEEVSRRKRFLNYK